MRVLYHYTSRTGHDGILASGVLLPSLAARNPNDVRYGEGQYLSDIRPGTMIPEELSRTFYGFPFQARRFTHYVAIDVTGLTVTEGRPGVFVVLGTEPLDLTGRLVGHGEV